MKSDEVIRIVKEMGLRPAVKRNVCLFGLSCVMFAYDILLKREMGFSIFGGSLGGRWGFHDLLNEPLVAKETEQFCKKNFSKLGMFFDNTKDKTLKCRKELEETKKNIALNHEQFLKDIIRIYPEYMLCICIYNSFYRYFGNDSSGKLSPEMMQRIAKDRDGAAKIYPLIEEYLKTCVDLIGKEYDFDGDLLRYMTLNELKEYVNNKSVSNENLATLAKRREGYFLLRVDGKEDVFTENEVIQNIKNEFFKTDMNTDVIRGSTAYPGTAKGIVYNPAAGKIPEGDFVLVTSMTHPNNTSLIGKCLAIVTDEGGILCHAAVISREMQKPCIVGTKIATQVLKDGDMVEVDAEKGIVKVIERK